MRSRLAALALVVLALAGVVRAEGNLVVTVKWETQGTDIDIAVLTPDGKATKPADDVTSGPGQEVCTIPNAGPGTYLVTALYFGPGDGPKTPVTVEVRVGDKVESTSQAVLERAGEGRIVRMVTIGDAPSNVTKVGPGDITVTMKWATEGTDVDLIVLGPDLRPMKAEKDILSGPGEETCTIRSPKSGLHLVGAVYANSKGGQKTPVEVTLRVGDKQEGPYQSTLERDGESKLIRVIEVPEGAAKLPTPPEVTK